MAGPLLKMEIMGYRDVKGRLARRTPELAAARRDMMRDLARSMVSTLRHYAPKRTGEFAAGIGFRTDERGSRTTATFYVRGKHAFLLPILSMGGTRWYEIPKGGRETQLAKGYPLHWIDQSGAHIRAWSVWHPPMIPHPFIPDAIEAMTPQFEYGLAQTARRVAWLA